MHFLTALAPSLQLAALLLEAGWSPSAVSAACSDTCMLFCLACSSDLHSKYLICQTLQKAPPESLKVEGSHEHGMILAGSKLVMLQGRRHGFLLHCGVVKRSQRACMVWMSSLCSKQQDLIHKVPSKKSQRQLPRQRQECGLCYTSPACRAVADCFIYICQHGSQGHFLSFR